jgi:hypothetical protein
MTKKKIVVVGNCQARPIATLLAKMSDEIEVTKVAIVHLLKSEQEGEYKPFFEEADYIIAQLVNENYPCEFVRTGLLKELYQDKVTTIVNIFSKRDTPYLDALPSNLRIENVSRPFGDYHFPIVYDCWKNGESAEHATGTLIKLHDANKKGSIKEESLALKEKDCDVPISDFFSGIKERVFHTFNHPSNTLLTTYSLRILKVIGCKTKHQKHIYNEYLDNYIPFVNENLHKLDRINSGVLEKKTLSTIDLVNDFYNFYDFYQGKVNRKKNICICISGQVRGNFKALQQLKNHLEANEGKVNYTIIFSVWDKKSDKSSGVIGFSQLFRICSTELAELVPFSQYKNFWSFFSGIRLKKDTKDIDLFDHIRGVFPNAIIDIEPELLGLSFSNFPPDINSKKMLYKRWRCNEIKLKVEDDNKSKFDVVVVSRPDLILGLRFDALDKFDNKNVYMPTSRQKNYTNDMFAYGSSIIMDKYCSLFGKTVTSDKWTLIHHELHEHLEMNNIAQRPNTFAYSSGLEAGELLTLADTIGHNDLFDNSIRNADSSIDIMPSATDDTKIIYHIRKYQNALRKKNYLEALTNLLDADFTIKELVNIPHQRLEYFEQKLAFLLAKTDKSLLKLIIEATNPLLKCNLQALRERTSFINQLNSYLLADAIANNDVSYLKAFESAAGLDGDLADELRDMALQYEGNDISLAYAVMKLAKDVRPNGAFIVKKYAEYKNKLGLE